MLSWCRPDSPKVVDLEEKPDIFAKKWDQSKFSGRVKHFATVVNPLNLLVPDSKLLECRKIVLDYKAGIIDKNLTVDELWRAKHLFDSAFHPETYELSHLLGRFSCQVPTNTVIHAGMMTFYKHPISVVFWQWLNQTSNALLNYTNRAGIDEDTRSRIFNSYLLATGGALSSSLGLNYLCKKSNFPTIINRMVPFVAIAIANIINIPTMRFNEFTTGITIRDEHDNKIGTSTAVAKMAITTVIIGRLFNAFPDMCISPIFVDWVSKQPWYGPNRWVAGPIQTTIGFFCLLIATPLGCALFPQDLETTADKLEPELQEKIRKLDPQPKRIVFNKGL
uniref:Sidoreflexin n=1 Tax=Parastrongyloides trichosuri TaxID=131310 RepID=A0A0N4Z5V8_PARTI